MAAAPNATLVLNWFMTERMGGSLDVPLTRQRWVGDGEGLDVGDRVLPAIRPPVYDAPTTRGLYDPTTGVYWASDSFATPMLTPVRTVDEIDTEFWVQGLHTFARCVSPWLTLVADDRFQATVDRVAALHPSVMAGCHTPAISGRRVAAAIATVRQSPTANVPDEPDQAVLEQIQHALQTLAA
jgi:flavorubredoxin